MSNPNPTPDISTNSKPEDIKAAYDAALSAAAQAPQQPPPAPPAGDAAAVPVPPTAGAEPPPTPPPPTASGDWGEVHQQADGSFSVKLADGTVFSGSPEDCLAKLGEAKVRTVEWARGQAKPAPAAPAAPAAPVAEPDPLAETRQWMLDQMALGLGLKDGKELQSRLEAFNDVAQTNHATQVAMQFRSECPDFPTTDQASSALLKYMVDTGMVRTDAEGNPVDHDVTAAKLKTAHAACVQYGVYKPLSQEEIAAQWDRARQAPAPSVAAARPTPPPMLQQAAPVAVQEAAKQVDHNSSADDILKAYNAELAKVRGAK
jgi:hypothetical protein